MSTFSTSLHRLRAVAAAITLAGAGLAQAAPTWITIGEEAHALLQKVAPSARVMSSTAVAVTRPADTRGSAMLRATETVHAVEIDDAEIEPLAVEVHEELKRCGGFVQHRSMAEALAALHRLQSPEPALLAPSYTIDSQARVNPLLPLVQESHILSTIQGLSSFTNRRYNSSHGQNASTWLFNLWKSLNPGNRRDISVTQITHAGWPQKSVEFSIIGSGNSGETIVLGAHLDSIGSGGTAESQVAPGADDDASGVAGLTEVIRVLMAGNYFPQRNLRFIAYANEETGLRGSGDIAAAQSGRRDKVVGVLQLDMTAFQGDVGKDIWIYTDYTNAAQNQFLASLVGAYLPTLNVNYSACGYGCSDHASWHNRGFIASFPHEASNANYNRAIHTPNDTLATFGTSAAHAAKFTRLALAYAVELASDATPAARPAEAASAGASRATAAR